MADIGYYIRIRTLKVKVKCKAQLYRYVTVCVVVRLHEFLTSAVDGIEWSASGSVRLIPRSPSTLWIGGRLGPRAVWNLVAKRNILAYTRNLTTVVQFVGSYWLNSLSTC
jgi:hypothetical protein